MINFKSYAENFISEPDYLEKLETAKTLMSRLQQDPMSGWVDLPIDYDKPEFARIKTAAKKIQQDSKYLVCIGIGGSYLGHKAVIETLGENSPTKILYAGNSLSPLELSKIIDQLGDADFSVNIISKSGTTTEPAIAFRIFKQKLIEKYGKAAASKRIYATTDASKGALHSESVENGYEMFVIPDNIGGRYSVLTAVGLLSIAVAGIDIDKLMDGAEEERATLISDGGNAAEYAALRNVLLDHNFNIEILANFEPSFLYFNEWWKQLFGESEGKNGQGIYPASVIDSTDLHSMGQYIQDGRRNLFETFVKIREYISDIDVPVMETNLDDLRYLEGKGLNYINEQAQAATRAAHLSGGVPVLEITMPDISARSLGALIYFFEMSCALSGFLLGVDPFNQPGVEAYKNNMFHLLGKPGHK
ncbi:MAG: glucose-6-phosphate isomerase [Candidatus Nomurabacteria bacterium]|jgi:glucose-6-phosphate isomerase|nr:glucose-6-phosphate isomerase [Candidatus Nomurabacteria bacterium]